MNIQLMHPNHHRPNRLPPRPALWLHTRGTGLHYQLRHQIPHGQGTGQRRG